MKIISITFLLICTNVLGQSKLPDLQKAYARELLFIKSEINSAELKRKSLKVEKNKILQKFSPIFQNHSNHIF